MVAALAVPYPSLPVVSGFLALAFSLPLGKSLLSKENVCKYHTAMTMTLRNSKKSFKSGGSYLNIYSMVFIQDIP